MERSNKLSELTERENAILCFGDRFYEANDHQRALQNALENENIEIDYEDVVKCKGIEKEYGMCAMNHYVININSEEDYLIIQATEYFKNIKWKALKELWDEYKMRTKGYSKLRIGYCLNYRDDNNCFKTLFIVTGNFSEFKKEVKAKLKDKSNKLIQNFGDIKLSLEEVNKCISYN